MVNPYAPPLAKSAPPLATSSPPPTVEHSVDHPWTPFAVIVVGLLIPGLPSLRMRRRNGGRLLPVALLVTIPCAFCFFGPFWGEVLFVGRPQSELGLYPFIVICVLVPVASVWLGFRDRC